MLCSGKGKLQSLMEICGFLPCFLPSAHRQLTRLNAGEIFRYIRWAYKKSIPKKWRHPNWKIPDRNSVSAHFSQFNLLNLLSSISIISVCSQYLEWSKNKPFYSKFLNICKVQYLIQLLPYIQAMISFLWFFWKIGTSQVFVVTKKCGQRGQWKHLF